MIKFSVDTIESEFWVFTEFKLKESKSDHQWTILQLTAVSNDDLLGGLAALRAEWLDLLDDVHTLDDTTENDVLTVQPISKTSGYSD